MCLEIWNKLNKPPLTALKKIEAGRLKGKTDISPQWRYQIMTDVFGPCGVGWKYTVDKKWTEPGPDGQVFSFVDISLYIKQGEAWSAPIPGNGGDMLIEKESRGLHANDEAFKMATTDALGTAMKMLGMAAEVYLGNFDGSKYINQPKPEAAKPEEKRPDIPEKLGQAPEEEYAEFQGQGEIIVEKVSKVQASALLSTMKREGITEEAFISKFTFKVADTPKAMHQEALAWIFEASKKEKAA